MLIAVAIFWGAGFVLNAQLLKPAFNNTPSLLNAVRFGVSALCLLAVFNKKIRFNKHILLYGGVGGALLFVGFLLQVVGIKYTSPSHSGFFTAFYAVLVPIVAWIAYRKRPHWVTFAAVALAVGGLLLLNFTGGEQGGNWKGDVITLAGALMFALQIVWSDWVLKNNKTDYVQLTFWQIVFGAVLFVLYSVIFESKYYSTLTLNPSYDIWRLAIVTLGGTAFAYYAQSYAQINLAPTETSLILACESPIGAALSMAIGQEPFLWGTVAGGLLVVAAVVLVEIAPSMVAKRKLACTKPQPPPSDDGSTQSSEDVDATNEKC